MDMDSKLAHLDHTIKILHILSPVSITVAYLIGSLGSVVHGRKASSAREPRNEGTRQSRVPCIILSFLVMAAYIAQSVLLACLLPSHAATSSDHNLAFALFSALVWLTVVLALVDTVNATVVRVFSTAWTVAFLYEVVFLVLGLVAPVVQRPVQRGETSCQLFRVAMLLGLLGTVVIRVIPTGGAETASDEEAEPLLARLGRPSTISGTATATGKPDGRNANDRPNECTGEDGSNPGAEEGRSEEVDEEEEEEKAEIQRLRQDTWSYLKAYTLFWPCLWPQGSVRLQLHLPALFVCLLSGRLLNVVVPLQLGVVVNALRDSGGKVPWMGISLLMTLRYLDSSAGVNLLQSWLWLPLHRYATERLEITAYGQLMNQSSDFHDSKKSGRVWRTLGRGTSLALLVDTVAFDLLPLIIDLIVAVSVFWWLFDAYVAFLVSLSCLLFLWATKKIIPMKTGRQRTLIEALEKEHLQMTESSLNWTTVALFNRIGYEQDQYAAAVRKSQDEYIKYDVLALVVNALRRVILQMGLVFASLLAAHQIVKGGRKVGDFVVLITYWTQLTSPLNFVAHSISGLAKLLVDAEKLLILLRTKPSIRERNDARELEVQGGRVDFDHVSFSYNGKRPVLDGVSFRAEPGQTVALVGETGGGKSTVLKLIFRFYDISSGSVLIDGQDIRDVTLLSLRANVGCVPQDPVLFNQTIMQNLKYARLDATDEEVERACRAVSLHDKIMSFSKGYSEKVGERGVKLSGGEIQRLAIARAILKDARILLLDEATSSVDSETEAVIQSSLKKLCAGRTTFVVAHRLSTIVHADQVMVVKGGRVVECGPHDELLGLGGHYHRLWTRQLSLRGGDEGAAGRGSTDAGTRPGSPRPRPAVLDGNSEADQGGGGVDAAADDTALVETDTSGEETR